MRAQPALWVGLVVGLCFSALKLSGTATDLCCLVLGSFYSLIDGYFGHAGSVHGVRHLIDPTDLVALPAVFLCYLVLKQRRSSTCQARDVSPLT